MVRWLTWTKFRTSPRKMRGKFRTKLKYGIFPAEKSPRGISPRAVRKSSHTAIQKHTFTSHRLGRLAGRLPPPASKQPREPTAPRWLSVFRRRGDGIRNCGPFALFRSYVCLALSDLLRQHSDAAGLERPEGGERQERVGAQRKSGADQAHAEEVCRLALPLSEWFVFSGGNCLPPPLCNSYAKVRN